MKSLLIKNALVINEGESYLADVLTDGERIARIDRNGISHADEEIIDATGMWLIPGVIDDQVHFREPGLTHKADLETESKAAIAGGVTSFMDMPNVNPQTVTQELLKEKYALGQQRSWANYSFFMGTTNDNYQEVVRTNPADVCGIKIFMGSSTGSMLVDDEKVLRKVFADAPVLIATHCECEARIKARLQEYHDRYNGHYTPEMHAEIRDEETCWLSSSFAKEIATEHNTRLHILHLTTAKELDLFRNDIPIKEKRITSEVCVHHLHFSKDDYARLGNQIKCNPAIKAKENRTALWEALLDNRLDIIATDHAPHTWQEKSGEYAHSHAGLPLVQHSLQMMLEYAAEDRISKERVVEKMCHAPADCFRVKDRGYLREGYYADMVLVDPSKSFTVSKENIRYKCGWSPLEGSTFRHSIRGTVLNGQLVYLNGEFTGKRAQQRLMFDR